MPVCFCTRSLKLHLSGEGTLMGGFVADLDFLLLTFVAEPPMDACDEMGWGPEGTSLFKLTMAVGFCSSCGRGTGKGLFKVMNGEGERAMEEGLC